MPLLKVENLSKTFDGPAKLFGSEQFSASRLVGKKHLRLLVKMVQENRP